MQASIFWEAELPTQITSNIQQATDDDIHKFEHWKEELEEMLAHSANETMRDSLNGSAVRRGEVLTLDEAFKERNGDGNPLEIAESAIAPVELNHLQTDQHRVYDIIKWHIDQHLAGKGLPQLLMQIHSEGGTGKSKVLQMLTEYFKKTNSLDLLVKVAYTGIAASLINGKTTHIARRISVNGKELSDKSKSELERQWANKEYLIINEISMISKAFLAKLSRNISIARNINITQHRPFGGLNVIICGDFHQFPPVVTKQTLPLYYPIDHSPNETSDNVIGREIYQRFTTVIILKDQIHVTNEQWLRFL
jgi:hypothetical protein